MEAATVERWLEKIGKDRAWLAAQCKVSRNTVKGWLSAGRPITGAAEALIERLMDEQQRIDPEFSLSEWTKMEERARLEGFASTQDWVDHVLKAELAKAPAPKNEAPTVKSGATSKTAPPVGSSNITKMPPQHHRDRAADEPGKDDELPPPTSVSYSSGKRRKKGA